jgi:hypothetical protein
VAAGNTYVAIATYTIPSAQASYTFSSIPSTYTDLIIVANIATTVADEDLYLQFNGDTATNYSVTQLRANGTTATCVSVTDSGRIGWMGYTGTTDAGLVSTMHIQNYANTTTYKTVLDRGSLASGWVTTAVGLWRSTSAINSIKVIAGAYSFKTGSTISLYGIAAA